MTQFQDILQFVQIVIRGTANEEHLGTPIEFDKITTINHALKEILKSLDIIHGGSRVFLGNGENYKNENECNFYARWIALYICVIATLWRLPCHCDGFRAIVTASAPLWRLLHQCDGFRATVTASAPCWLRTISTLPFRLRTIVSPRHWSTAPLKHRAIVATEVSAPPDSIRIPTNKKLFFHWQSESTPTPKKNELQ